MVNEFIKAFLLIFVAEIGDKTQILAMTFATQYSTVKVLIGIFIGSILNHGLAIVLGTYLSGLFTMNKIQIIAGFAFIIFGIWTLRYDGDKGDEKNLKNKLGPVMTVSLAFFIGELGDKTQLTAMTLGLGAEDVFPIFTLLGTVFGMIVTSAVGIFIGKKIGEKVPEIAIKLISSSLFTFFGILKLIQSVPKVYINLVSISAFIAVLGIILIIFTKRLIVHYVKTQKAPLKEAAATLHTKFHKMREAIEDICLEINNCGKCKGKECLVGFAKHVLDISQQESSEDVSLDWSKLPKKNNIKSFNQDQIAHALSMIIDYINSNKDEIKHDSPVNKARHALEIIAFTEALSHIEDIDLYLKEVEKRDKILMKKIEDNLNKIQKEKREQVLE